jgi:3-dehydroquinate dehydratase / shikimate dehydrogenase
LGLKQNGLFCGHGERKTSKPLAKLYADPRVMGFWEVKTLKESTQEYHHFVSSIEKHGWGFWAVELREGHQFIGLIGLENIGFQAHFTPAVEIGWHLDYDFWGKEYATEGAKAAPLVQ